MKCLTIQQSWADLILGRISDEAEGPKDVENRTWSTSYRGPLLIHAGKTIDKAAMNVEDIGPYTPATGVILGRVELVDIVFDESPSVWAQPEYFHWILRNPTVFDQPIPYKGRLGLFDVPDEVVARFADPGKDWFNA